MRLVTGKKVAVLLIILVAISLVCFAGAETTQLIARGSIAADATDKNGETIGGIGSGLAYDAKENVLFAISDRGPGDGTIDYCPRFDVLRLSQSADTKSKLNLDLLHTVLLHDRDGKEMTGLAPDVSDKSLPQRR